MSVTLSSLRARVLAQLQEMDSRKAIGRILVDQTIRNQYREMEARLPASLSITTSAGTITAGASTFTLPTTSSAEYAGTIRIQLQSDLSFLEKVSLEEMQRYRDGSSNSTGRPRYFAPFEASDQSVICWVFPMAQTTETYNLFRSLVAADTSSTDVAATTLPIGRMAQDALVNKTAAAILMAMAEPDVDLRRLNRDVAKAWDLAGERLIYLESDRRSSMESIGRIQRFVS